MKKLTQTSLIVLATMTTMSSLAANKVLLWKHRGNDVEITETQASIDRYNASQDKYAIEMTLIPEHSYAEAVTSAAISGDLPCVMMMDQPLVPNFAYNDYIIPLNDGLGDLLSKVSSTAQGTWNGNVYSVGQFDVALALFTRQAYLDKYGFRTATMEQPYTKDEFTEILKTLKDSGDFKYPLDVKTSWPGEWWSYSFGPWLASFGGDLINRDGFKEVDGVLNGEKAVEFGEWYQSLFTEGYADKAAADELSFNRGEAAIDYVGSWAIDNLEDSFDDIVIMPVPDFGNGPIIGAGSWQWAVSKSCNTPEAAFEFIKFNMQPEEIAAMSDATGLIPTTDDAAALTENFKEGGKWRIFYDFANEYALLRPETPAYKVITSAVEKAFRDIARGADVQDSLDTAVDEIESDLEDNNFYQK
ncbi:MAG: extracellular solute-binding protein [Alphaproteobacteria bacterium]